MPHLLVGVVIHENAGLFRFFLHGRQGVQRDDSELSRFRAATEDPGYEGSLIRFLFAQGPANRQRDLSRGIDGTI